MRNWGAASAPWRLPPLAEVVGRALNIRSPRRQGTYSVIGAGGAFAASAGCVQLQNEKGVILQLHGQRGMSRLDLDQANLWQVHLNQGAECGGRTRWRT